MVKLFKTRKKWVKSLKIKKRLREKTLELAERRKIIENRRGG